MSSDPWRVRQVEPGVWQCINRDTKCEDDQTFTDAGAAWDREDELNTTAVVDARLVAAVWNPRANHEDVDG